MSHINMVKNRLEGMFLHDRTGIDPATVQIFESELRDLFERYFSLENFDCSFTPLDSSAEIKVSARAQSRRTR